MKIKKLDKKLLYMMKSLLRSYIYEKDCANAVISNRSIRVAFYK